MKSFGKILKLSVVPAILFSLSSQVNAAKPNPYLMKDNAWITISGTITSVNPDSFLLDYGDGSVLVEVDDGDFDNDAFKFIDGDNVTVSGAIDDDLFETTKIEASSIYVESLNTTFLSSAIDEESQYLYFSTSYVPLAPSEMTLVGTIAKVAGEKMYLDVGENDVAISVSEMLFNPLDDIGYLKIDKGDRVKVNIDLETKPFGSDFSLDATSIVKLNNKKTK